MKTRPWQVWLPAILMSVTGAGWFAWAATPEALSQEWLPDWPLALIVAGGVIHFAAAWGLLQRRAWGWIVALLYMSIGAISLLSQVAALILPVPHFLFLLEAIALLSAPYLIRNRQLFFRRVIHAG